MVQYLSFLAAQSPVLIALAIMLIVALVRWQEHPRVSALVSAFAVLELVLVAGGLALNMWLPTVLRERGAAPASYVTAFAVIAFVRACLHTGGLVLIACAAFGWRTANPRS